MKGDEAVTLVNASPKGRLSFPLPGQAAPALTVALTGGEDLTPEAHLDTVILEPDEQRVLLLWRAHVVLGDGLHDVRTVRVTAEGVSRPPEPRS